MICFVKLFILLFGISACHAFVLRVYQGSIDKYEIFSENNATDMIPYLNMSRPTCFYVFGIKGDPTVLSVTTVMTTFIDADEYNMVLLDWTEEAKTLLDIVILSYAAYNAPNAEQVGCRFGIILVALIRNGLSVSNFFLMGHSMGAQIMGVAGRCAKAKGEVIGKIIGLDPAGPGFTTVIPVLPTLDTSCAVIVIIIHTDPNGYGTGKATGHIDYYPNYNKTYTMQPGCTEKSNPFVLNRNTTCSHDLAWRLICACVKYAHLLKAEHAIDGDAWLAGLGNRDDTSYLSIDPTPGASGSYYMRTVPEYPYGLGEDGINP